MHNLHIKITTIFALTVGVACGGTAIIAWHAAQPLVALPNGRQKTFLKRVLRFQLTNDVSEKGIS